MSSKSSDATPRRRPLWQRLLGLFLVTAAASYLIIVLQKDAPAILTTLRKIAAWKLVAASIAAAFMGLLNAAYHRNLLLRISNQIPRGESIMLAYSEAQVVRYLPGKIWGLVHQSSQLSSHFKMHEVVLANTLQMLMTNLLSLGVIGSILGASLLHSPWPLVGIPLSLVAIEWMHRNPFLEQLLVRAAQRFARVSPGDFITKVRPVRWRGTAILATEWLAYFAVWGLVAHQLLAPLEIAVLGAWYAAASLLAILAIAVPAGLAVREAMFVSLAATGAFPNSVLIALAALLRAITMAGEVVAVLIIWLTRKMFGKIHG
jgi:uncharacterized membrane protein YbhN (UPF0104 family)